MTITETNTTLDWNEIRVGAELPVLEIAVTATVVVAGAIATRDFMPVHHDRDYANMQGAPDIFTNIMTDNGYCSRFLTDWAGPEAMVKRLAIRLGAPACAGSTLRYSGTVTGKSRAEGEGLVEVTFRAALATGDHLSGTAVIGLPLSGARR